MLPRKPPMQRVLMLTLPALLLSACASVPLPPPPAVVPPPRIPELPQEARQRPRPPICLPSCPAGLQRLLDSMLTLPKTP